MFTDASRPQYIREAVSTVKTGPAGFHGSLHTAGRAIHLSRRHSTMTGILSTRDGESFASGSSEPSCDHAKSGYAGPKLGKLVVGKRGRGRRHGSKVQDGLGMTSTRHDLCVAHEIRLEATLFHEGAVDNHGVPPACMVQGFWRRNAHPRRRTRTKIGLEYMVNGCTVATLCK